MTIPAIWPPSRPLMCAPLLVVVVEIIAGVGAFVLLELLVELSCIKEIISESVGFQRTSKPVPYIQPVVVSVIVVTVTVTTSPVTGLSAELLVTNSDAVIVKVEGVLKNTADTDVTGALNSELQMVSLPVIEKFLTLN